MLGALAIGLLKVVLGFFVHKGIDHAVDFATERKKKTMAEPRKRNPDPRDQEIAELKRKLAEQQAQTPAADETVIVNKADLAEMVRELEAHRHQAPQTPAAPAPIVPAPADPALDPALVERVRQEILRAEEINREIERIAAASRQQAQQPAPIVLHPNPTDNSPRGVFKRLWNAGKTK